MSEAESLRLRKLLLYFARLCTGLSVALYVACLFQDAYYFNKADAVERTPALSVLLMGWYGLIGGNVAWLANPCLALGWALFAAKKPVLGLVASALSLALMLSFMVDPSVMVNEDARSAHIDGYGKGFWLWLASAATLLIASFVAALPTDFIARKDGSP